MATGNGICRPVIVTWTGDNLHQIRQHIPRALPAGHGRALAVPCHGWVIELPPGAQVLAEAGRAWSYRPGPEDSWGEILGGSR